MYGLVSFTSKVFGAQTNSETQVMRDLTYRVRGHVKSTRSLTCMCALSTVSSMGFSLYFLPCHCARSRTIELHAADGDVI